jgi:transcriptional regulator with XRE-family HTH domain
MEQEKESFSVWLKRELTKLHWTAATFAHVTGLHRSSVARVLRGDQDPGEDFCRATAKALGTPPAQVFRMAGILPSYPIPDDQRGRFMEIWDCLPEARRNQLYELAEIMLRWESVEGWIA